MQPAAAPEAMLAVEVWTDLTCPWCYLGKRRLERAVHAFEHPHAVQVRYRSFERDAAAVAAGEDAAAEAARATAAAAQEGLDLPVDHAVPARTFDAHRLMHLGEAEGGPALQAAVAERMFAAHFCEGKALDDPRVLQRVGAGGRAGRAPGRGGPRGRRVRLRGPGGRARGGPAAAGVPAVRVGRPADRAWPGPSRSRPCWACCARRGRPARPAEPPADPPRSALGAAGRVGAHRWVPSVGSARTRAAPGRRTSSWWSAAVRGCLAPERNRVRDRWGRSRAPRPPPTRGRLQRLRARVRSRWSTASNWLGRSGVEVVAGPLGLGPVDHADRPLQPRLVIRLGHRRRRGGEQEPAQADAVEQRLVAARQGRPDPLALGRPSQFEAAVTVPCRW